MYEEKNRRLLTRKINSNGRNKGITLIALVITIIVLLILAGITINALTGSENAPAKANEAEQKNDIGSAKDQISLTAVNAKTDAYDAAYVGNGISSSEASNSVGRAVIKAVAEQIQAKNQYGKATVKITDYGTIANITNNATIAISTRDFELTGTITLQDGILTWGEIEPNVPSIKITNAPETLGVGKNVTLLTEIKRVNATPTVEWSSSDEDIATVNESGKVIGVAEGDVTITAKITVGEVDYFGICNIAIELAPIELGTQGSIEGNYIDLGVDLDDDSTTPDWKIIYNDTDNNVIYAMTDKYLKVGKVPTGIGLETSGDFSVWKTERSVNNSNSQTRAVFIEGLKNATAWKNSLISSDILSAYPAIEVYGALEKGDSTTPKTIEYLKEKIGSYYTPSNESSMNGYWLASRSNVSDSSLYYFYKKNPSYLKDDGYYFTSWNGVCPAVILPSDIQVTSTSIGTKTLWSVDSDD